MEHFDVTHLVYLYTYSRILALCSLACLRTKPLLLHISGITTPSTARPNITNTTQTGLMTPGSTTNLTTTSPQTNGKSNY